MKKPGVVFLNNLGQKINL